MNNVVTLGLLAAALAPVWAGDFQEVGFLGVGYQAQAATWAWKGADQGAGTFAETPTFHGFYYGEGAYIDADWDALALVRQGGGDPWTIREASLFDWFPRVAFGLLTADAGPVALGLGADFATLRLAQYSSSGKKFLEKISANAFGLQGVGAAHLVRTGDNLVTLLVTGTLGRSMYADSDGLAPGEWYAAEARLLWSNQAVSAFLGASWSSHRLPGVWDASGATTTVEAAVRSVSAGLTFLFPDD